MRTGLSVFLFLATAINLSAPSQAQDFDLDPVIVQLKWEHQFQFAGYYAAVEKGFYREKGLEVELLERTPEWGVVETVVEGRADYGVGDGGIILDRMEGAPIVVLAQIYQHSPLAFLSLRESGILSPYEMVGKKAMCDIKGNNQSSLAAMLMNTVGDMDRIEFVPQNLSLGDFIEGRVDIISAYTTNEPYKLRKLGIETNLILPQSYGIDFYGDNFFTTQQEVRENPDRVERMVEATLKGWEYALDHPEEIIDLILATYSPGSDRDKLRFEAKETKKLISRMK